MTGSRSIQPLARSNIAHLTREKVEIAHQKVKIAHQKAQDWTPEGQDWTPEAEVSHQST